MTRRKPTPAEEKCPPESCFYCHHVMRTWNLNYAPDMFNKNDGGWACKFDPLDPVKIYEVCVKFHSCYQLPYPKGNYPFVVMMGGIEYAFNTKEEYKARKKIWLEGLNL